MIEQIQKKAKEAREEFVSKRAFLEKEISTFADNIKKVDPVLISHIVLPNDISARSIFPSLYRDKVNIAEYEQEKVSFASTLRLVDDVRNRLIKEAEAELNGR